MKTGKLVEDIDTIINSPESQLSLKDKQTLIELREQLKSPNNNKSQIHKAIIKLLKILSFLKLLDNFF